MNTHICIHGHFYQPPRENPWLEAIEVQDSAYPYRDWNERITAECYNPNTASRIMAEDQKTIDIINNYAYMSFNFGPTLLSWMEENQPDVYQRIIDADLESRNNFNGHGSAIAQVYNHMIMPLANMNDKRTQIVWGKADFIHRFKREPEAMWLAETAVDTETLELLAEWDMRFTILAPHQAKRVKKIDDADDTWIDTPDASIDPKMPYLCKLPSGREIVIFFYDGPVSHDLSFGDLLGSGERYRDRLLASVRQEDETDQLVHVATDGETYGHHHRYGDMALAYCLHEIKTRGLAELTVYGSYLETFPPTLQVEINENTSWSCMHGVERWKNDCGCTMGHPHWNQQWRAPLRDAFDWLRDTLIPVFERCMREYTSDPWKLRDDYISVILERTPENIDTFIAQHARAGIYAHDRTKILSLLEMQRHALLMYTSCGWFFDEVSGIETVQVMLYAARVLQLAKDAAGVDLEEAFVKRLMEITSNIPDVGTAARAYELYVRPSVIDFSRAGAHYAISMLFNGNPDVHEFYAYSTSDETIEKYEAGKWKMVIGRTVIRSRIIQNEDEISFGFIHLGDHNVFGGVKHFPGMEEYEATKNSLKEVFSKLNLAEVIHMLDTGFGGHSYTLWHLFKEETRKVLLTLADGVLTTIDASYRHIYEDNYSIMQAMRDTLMPLPTAFTIAVQYTVNQDLKSIIAAPAAIDQVRFRKLHEEARKWNVALDKEGIGYAAEKGLNALMESLLPAPMNEAVIKELLSSLETMKVLGVACCWKAQNILFHLWRTLFPRMKAQAAGDEAAKAWIEQFFRIADNLQIRFE